MKYTDLNQLIRSNIIHRNLHKIYCQLITPCYIIFEYRCNICREISDYCSNYCCINP